MFFNVIAVFSRKLTPLEYAVLAPLMASDGISERGEKKPSLTQSSLLGGILVRMELSRLTGLKNSSLHIERDIYGKPFIRGIPDLHFNISHSGNLVIAAFHTKPVGIDIEIVRPFNQRIIQRVFSPYEQSRFDRLPESEKQAYFYSIWTMKEAYLKKLGIGLSLPMQTLDIRSLDGVYFFPISVGSQALCHVCASDAGNLVYRECPVETVLEWAVSGSAVSP